MKDSGKEHIGLIPEDWKCMSLKFCLSESMKYGASESGVEYDGCLPRYIRITDIDSDGNLKDEGKLSLTKAQASGYMLKDKTVLFARSGGTVGKSFLYKKEMGEAAFAGYLISAVVDKNIILPEWLMYFTCSSSYKEWTQAIFNQATIQNIGADKYSNMPIPVAPMSEQRKIVKFLDKKCQEIDKLIRDLNEEISILNHYKMSIITEKVTKGLDKDAQMKHSNEEWIGDVPADWDVIRIGHLFSMRNERNFLSEDKVQLLSLYTGIGVFPQGEHEARGNKAQTVDGYKIVRKNDIVVNIILAWMGAIGVSEYNGVTSPAYDVYIPDIKKVVPHYYHYVFRTNGIAGECYKYGRGIMLMRWRTYSTEFKQIKVPFPPIEVQKRIADYLDYKCSEIDAVIEEKKTQISILEDYKKVMIYEYITGKKKVKSFDRN